MTTKLSHLSLWHVVKTCHRPSAASLLYNYIHLPQTDEGASAGPGGGGAMESDTACLDHRLESVQLISSPSADR